MKKILITGAWLISYCFWSCKQRESNPPAFSNKAIGQVIRKMTEIMLHDVTNPPLAARFYAYACLSGYEVVAQHDSGSISMHAVLNEYPSIRKPDSLSGYSYQLAALLSMMETARKMQPSGNQMEDYEKIFLDSCRQAGYPDAIITPSVSYAKAISRQILAYALSDRYNRISNLPRYTPLDGDGYWYPTPPSFMPAVEPYFNTVRPFVLDSAAQFKQERPAAFSTNKNSAFYHLMESVYQESLSQTAEHKEIAGFWDCNPFAVQDNGHLMVGLKKISPGAHWLGITAIACENANKSFGETLFIHTAVALGLMDAFICCWDEKYRSNRIRPETAIRKYIQPEWKPLLQTPPFPEYLSGHSCVSAASAVILTRFFGDHFSYTDNVELNYGLSPRHFESFKAAASEAAVSRFYGGIHFMDAINNGSKQGTLVGELIIRKLFGK